MLEKPPWFPNRDDSSKHDHPILAAGRRSEAGLVFTIIIIIAHHWLVNNIPGEEKSFAPFLPPVKLRLEEKRCAVLDLSRILWASARAKPCLQPETFQIDAMAPA